MTNFLNNGSTSIFCEDLRSGGGRESAIEIFEMSKQVYEEGFMLRALAFEWCKQFSDGRDDVDVR
jgi:hypothetical protein